MILKLEENQQPIEDSKIEENDEPKIYDNYNEESSDIQEPGEMLDTELIDNSKVEENQPTDNSKVEENQPIETPEKAETKEDD